jgi:hypothetical protein
MKEWWVSCDLFTGWVKTNGNIIIDIFPMMRRWKGQSFSRFVSYYSAKKGELDVEGN